MGKPDIEGTSPVVVGHLTRRGGSGTGGSTTRKFHSLLLLQCLFCILFLLYVGLRVGNGLSLTGYRYWATEKLFQAYPISPIPIPTHECVASVPPISKNEFGSRQQKLAQLLSVIDGEAYIAEPGAQTQFFGNFSAVEWKLSERPLLLIIRRSVSGNATVVEVSLLTPKFEATRAKSLNIPFVEKYIEWSEEENPYAVAVKALGFVSRDGSFKGKKIIIDNSARHFHYDGFSEVLADTGLTVTSASHEINQLRERKSDAELEIMKCANEATLVAIRYVHKQMRIGMRESEARSMMSSALSRIGLLQGGCLTLFGENAALPHGSGTDKALESTDFALFDCTATLHGYWSDVTRTVALPSSQISSWNLQIWRDVFAAQALVNTVARGGAKARTVDEMARFALRLRGLDKYFTHRLGHGIGLEGHEPPYLNGGSNAILQYGHTFSNEPGVYIEGKLGVRLEDCFYIGEWGMPTYLTAGVGGPSQTPWDP